jgi:hypothetical protein
LISLCATDNVVCESKWKMEKGIALKRLLLLLLCISCAGSAAVDAGLHYDSRSPQVAFAASEIRKAYAAAGKPLVEETLAQLPGDACRVRIAITSDAAQAAALSKSLGAPAMKSSEWQSYSIRRVNKGGSTTFAVLAANSAGAMYGGLDVAEAVRLGTLDALGDSDHTAHVKRRGIKFNVPLDARTPSYSDNSDAAQENIAEMWSLDFWSGFLDEMARHRYNVLSLWNLHPFPSLVKTPEYPDVALNDVTRTLVPMDDTFSLNGTDMVRPDMLTKLVVVKRISIEDKIAFWRQVMQLAHERGIEVYWFTWNIFTWGAEGKYGITSKQDNQKTIDYFRASVRELVLTYPLLDGIGITAGEHMEERKDEFSKEKWLWNAYGRGIVDALKVQPDRKFRMIHRYHQTSTEEVMDAWKDYPDTFELSFKYAIAHMYSIPNPPFIQPALPHITKEHRTWLTVRDDDVYSFRWGNPEFARAFIKNMPGPDKMAGFYMGPDGTVWGREVISTEAEKPRELVISKRWYSFMLWGRLSYDPDLPDSLFERTIAVRFPQVQAPEMMKAWAEASKVFPEITRFFWGDIDARWFPEACLSHPRSAKGFYTVRDFVEGETMPGSGVISISAWRRNKLAGKPFGGITPLEVADNLAKISGDTLQAVSELRRKQGDNKELRLTLGDMEAMGYLAGYYSAKIRGAADLATFDKSGKQSDKDSAIKNLQIALEAWKRYARTYTVQYKQPLLYNRVGVVDLPGMVSKVEQDISIARLWAPGTVPDELKAKPADRPFRN